MIADEPSLLLEQFDVQYLKAWRIRGIIDSPLDQDGSILPYCATVLWCDRKSVRTGYEGEHCTLCDQAAPCSHLKLHDTDVQRFQDATDLTWIKNGVWLQGKGDRFARETDRHTLNTGHAPKLHFGKRGADATGDSGRAYCDLVDLRLHDMGSREASQKCNRTTFFIGR